MAMFRASPCPLPLAAARRRTGIGPALLLAGAILAAFPHGSGMAADGPLPDGWRLTYRIYVGGVHMLDATAHIGLGRDRYRVGLQAATDGFLGRVADWRTDIVATGSIAADGALRPALYRSVGAWRGEPRNTTLEYDADGTPRLTVAEPPPEEDREPVPDGMRPGTVDPMTAMVAAVQAVAAGRGCDATVPVYDGRQRYDLTFVPKGTETLAATDLSAFAGEAQLCGFEYKQLSGAWKGEDRRHSRDDGERRGRDERDGRDIAVWMATAAPGAPPVPVRAQGGSFLGTIMVHLARIEPAAAGSAEEAAAE